MPDFVILFSFALKLTSHVYVSHNKLIGLVILGVVTY